MVREGKKRQERKETKRDKGKETKEIRRDKKPSIFKGCTCGIADGGKAPGNLWQQRQAVAKAETNTKNRPDFQRALARSKIPHH